MPDSHWKYLSLHREQRVLTVTFDSGTRVNSLSNALMRELTELAVQLQDDSDLSAIILTGRADLFTGGMDLKDPELAAARTPPFCRETSAGENGAENVRRLGSPGARDYRGHRGLCIAGTALAVACDWRVASSTASMYVPELKLGMNMSWQSVPRFVKLIGPAKRKQFCYCWQNLWSGHYGTDLGSAGSPTEPRVARWAKPPNLPPLR